MACLLGLIYFILHYYYFCCLYFPRFYHMLIITIMEFLYLSLKSQSFMIINYHLKKKKNKIKDFKLFKKTLFKLNFINFCFI